MVFFWSNACAHPYDVVCIRITSIYELQVVYAAVELCPIVPLLAVVMWVVWELRRSYSKSPYIRTSDKWDKSLELCSSSGKSWIVFLTNIWFLGTIVGLAEYSVAHLLHNLLIWSPQIQGSWISSAPILHLTSFQQRNAVTCLLWCSLIEHFWVSQLV
jgi:hypothetical protein